MIEEKLKTVSDYLQESFPGAGEPACDQAFTTDDYLFGIKLEEKSLLLDISVCWLEDHLAHNIRELLVSNQIADMMLEHLDKIVVIRTTGITTRDK
ncbi:TPA: hypothetical protein I8220_000790 [Aeromonas hydrophila]|jgi:hypothetical protein|uniref:hypothetical protein n=1 Tax=Aeromonas hydrophila TaxID=644 RepID=UPI0004678C88|nr:hypothetical protein [Aeromonas hydrophila]BDC84076.1 hypothetical protein NUITMVA1_40190 [Aeromonas hydrophila]HAT2489433.1 hypothetical protein [Aeromonas hydrophila]HAT2493989.1 hypothetical protein [Aeromonas hydrophila]HAT2509635.1 hypothetical protein [Aeromonas hydrophila]HAT2530083.1 hypothetical protein [Aeromonas hydrophila]